MEVVRLLVLQLVLILQGAVVEIVPETVLKLVEVVFLAVRVVEDVLVVVILAVDV